MDSEKIQTILRDVTGNPAKALPEAKISGQWATWSKFDLGISHGMGHKMVEQLKEAGIPAFYRDNKLGAKV